MEIAIARSNKGSVAGSVGAAQEDVVQKDHRFAGLDPALTLRRGKTIGDFRCKDVWCEQFVDAVRILITQADRLD